MKIKILKVQKSKLPIWDTGLSMTGIINDKTSSQEQSYSMVVNFFDNELSVLPDKTIVIEEKHYERNIAKYGMEALLKGVELTSLLEVTQEPGDISDEQYKREIESIAYAIVGRMEQDTFFNNYNPSHMREYIEDKLMKLKEKFNIESK